MNGFAVVADRPWKVEYRQVEIPEPGPEDVVVRVVHSWISNGTEGSFIRGERSGGDTPFQDGDPLPFPHVPGYQKVGIVEAVGESVTGLQPGDWVFATVSKVCGMFFPTGGHVSPAVTHQSQVWKLPSSLPPVAASGLVLLQVGYNCGMRPPVETGDSAIVIGDGLVGHWTAQTLSSRGARIMLVGRHEERLGLYDAPGGTHPTSRSATTAFPSCEKTEVILVNERTDDVLGRAREWAPNGAAVLVDTVGSVSSIERFYPVLRHDAHLVSAGFHGHQGKIDIQPMRGKELTLHAPAGWNKARMDSTLRMLEEGTLRTEHLITHRFPAHQAPEAYSVILNRTGPVLGVVLDWEQ